MEFGEHQEKGPPQVNQGGQVGHPGEERTRILNGAFVELAADTFKARNVVRAFGKMPADDLPSRIGDRRWTANGDHTPAFMLAVPLR